MNSLSGPVEGHQVLRPFNRAIDAYAREISLEALIWESRTSPVSMPTAGEVHSMKKKFYFMLKIVFIKRLGTLHSGGKQFILMVQPMQAQK